MIKIPTERLLVRDPAIEDLAGWHKLKSDAQNMRFVEYLQTRTLEESRRDLQKAIDAAAKSNRDTYFFSVILAQTGAFIGSIGFKTEMTPAGLTGGAGWFLLPEHQGRGYASEAFRAMIPFMLNGCGIDLIDAGCKLANPASERVMQTCGMKLVRQYDDRVQYQLTKTDWETP